MSLLLAMAAAAATPAPALAPSEVVAAAPAADWVAIAPDDLLVMDLAPDAAGRARRVVIQLVPQPFSLRWTANIRQLAKARFWDGLSINRVQDNYVVQWGDADGEDGAKARKLPDGLRATTAGDYGFAFEWITVGGPEAASRFPTLYWPLADQRDSYSREVGFIDGWPVATWGTRALPHRRRNDRVREGGHHTASHVAPVHCYGTVGVGRGMPPDAGTGAELYTVIGHAPRHLDRNIAVVGRVIEGIEHLSSLPRGTGPLGFYETAAERVPIASIRIGSEVVGLPAYQYLSTASRSFAAYADARANRRDGFFIQPAGGADVCNVPVPIRRAP